VATGGLAGRLGRLLGIGSTAVRVWDIAKWPVLLLIVGFLFALLYWASPNARQPFRWITPGGILAVVVWVVASVAFALYVANFGSYNKTYGSLASVIIFLVWLAVAVQHRHPARRRAERRAGTRPGHRRRPPTGRGALHGAARHPKDPGTRRPVADIHHPSSPNHKRPAPSSERGRKPTVAWKGSSGRLALR
jgi:hypothetical protein